MPWPIVFVDVYVLLFRCTVLVILSFIKASLGQLAYFIQELLAKLSIISKQMRAK